MIPSQIWVRINYSQSVMILVYLLDLILSIMRGRYLDSIRNRTFQIPLDMNYIIVVKAGDRIKRMVHKRWMVYCSSRRKGSIWRGWFLQATRAKFFQNVPPYLSCIRTGCTEGRDQTRRSYVNIIWFALFLRLSRCFNQRFVRFLVVLLDTSNWACVGRFSSIGKHINMQYLFFYYYYHLIYQNTSESDGSRYFLTENYWIYGVGDDNEIVLRRQGVPAEHSSGCMGSWQEL